MPLASQFIFAFFPPPRKTVDVACKIPFFLVALCRLSSRITPAKPNYWPSASCLDNNSWHSTSVALGCLSSFERRIEKNDNFQIIRCSLEIISLSSHLRLFPGSAPNIYADHAVFLIKNLNFMMICERMFFSLSLYSSVGLGRTRKKEAKKKTV